MQEISSFMLHDPAVSEAQTGAADGATPQRAGGGGGARIERNRGMEICAKHSTIVPQVQGWLINGGPTTSSVVAGLCFNVNV